MIHIYSLFDILQKDSPGMERNMYGSFEVIIPFIRLEKITLILLYHVP